MSLSRWAAAIKFGTSAGKKGASAAKSKVDELRRSHRAGPGPAEVTMREWYSKILRALHFRRGLDDDLSAEMRAHLELITDENIERGMAPDDARAAARRHFGNVTRTQENAREAWQFPRFEAILQDVRYGLRGIRKSPGFP